MSPQVDKEFTKGVHSIPLLTWAFYHCSVPLATGRPGTPLILNGIAIGTFSFSFFLSIHVYSGLHKGTTARRTATCFSQLSQSTENMIMLVQKI